MISTPVITWLITHLPIPEGWKAELACFVPAIYNASTSPQTSLATVRINCTISQAVWGPVADCSRVNDMNNYICNYVNRC